MLKAVDRPIILCVEDEPTLLRDLCDELREAGYDAMGALDVPSAQRLLDSITPALIVCDVNLPGASGLDFMADLRGRDAWSDVPFMLLTALSDREHMLLGKRAGADDYLVKPVDYDILLASIEARLAQMGRVQRNHQAQLQQHADGLLFQWTNVLDKVSQCALVCGPDLGVRFANRAAYSLCGSSSDSPLTIGATGHIGLHPMIARHPDVQAFLNGDAEAVKVDIAGGGATAQSWQVSLLALNERTSIAQPVPHVARVDDQAFVVFLADLNQRHLHNKSALARRFQLTPTEVQVASLLTDGLSKQEMCERMKVSTTTMAFHLRNLFSKTATKRQAELVALLMSVAWNDIALSVPERA